MGIRRRIKQAAATATGVAMATTGLSSCTDGGAVDPLPPALECNDVSAGQTLTARAERTAADTVRVIVRHGQYYFAGLEVLQVSDLLGGTLVETDLPNPAATDSLIVTIALASPTPSEVSFTLDARLHDLSGVNPVPIVCDVRRTITVSITATGLTVAIRNRDPLPLPARQGTRIVLMAREGRTVELAHTTPYRGTHRVTWYVSAGEAGIVGEGRLRWTLPAEPGIYQAELVADFGPDGLAVDTMPFEVA